MAMRTAQPERVVVINHRAVRKAPRRRLPLSRPNCHARAVFRRAFCQEPRRALPRSGKTVSWSRYRAARHLLDRSAGLALTRATTARCVGRFTLGQPRSRRSCLPQPSADVAREEAPASNPRRCSERRDTRTRRRFRSHRGPGGRLSSRSRLRRRAGSAGGPAVCRVCREFTVHCGAVSPPLRVAVDRSAAAFPSWRRGGERLLGKARQSRGGETCLPRAADCRHQPAHPFYFRAWLAARPAYEGAARTRGRFSSYCRASRSDNGHAHHLSRHAGCPFLVGGRTRPRAAL